MKLEVLNFFLILILLIGYRFRLRFCYLASAIFSIFIILILRSESAYSRLITIFVFNTMPIISFAFRKKSSEFKEKLKNSLEEVRISYDRLLSKDKAQLQSNLEMERKIQKITSLYEISKQMAVGLSFEEIFEVLGNSIRRSFRFKTASLLIIKDLTEVFEAYRIEQQNKTRKFPPEEFDLEILKSVKAINGPLLLSDRQNESKFVRLSHLKRFETLVAVPLSIEGKILAILYIEDLIQNNFENFLILASQFAIQMERVFLYNEVQAMAITDSLTEVNTRRHLMERFTEELRRSMRHKSALSILILDIDHFKDKNDKFGHLVGDVILRDIGRLLKSNIREIDILGRYGGEEFVIVLSNIPKKEAGVVAERIRAAIENYKFKAYDEVVDATVSLGVAGFPEDDVDTEGLLECADRALYRAKEAGRNRVVVYNE